MMSDDKENKILTGTIWKQLLLFFFPIVLGSVFQVFYNTVDTVIVGRYVGTVALASVGGSSTILISLIIGFYVALTSGATVVIAQNIGAGDEKTASRAARSAMALALAGGVALGIASAFLSRPVLVMMKTPAEILDLSERYLQIYFGGSIFTLVYNMGSSVLRARGDSKRPFYLLAGGCVLNVFLDLYFVAWLGLGVAGVAWATVISQAVAAAGVWACLAREKGPCHVRFRALCFDWPVLRSIIAIGLPAALQISMYCFANLFLQAEVNSFGVAAVAAWTLYSKIDIFFWQVITSFSVALTTFAGQNFGARNYDRVIKGMWECVFMAAATSLVMGAACMMFAHPLVSLFSHDEEVVSLTMSIMKIITPFYSMYALLEVLAGGFRSTGDSVAPTVILAVCVCCFRIAWLWSVLPRFRSLNVLFTCYSLAWFISDFAFLAYYRWSGWLERSIRRSGQLSRE